MSRAFLKESTLEEPEVRPRGQSALPPGAKNLLTPQGAQRLRAELDDLLQQRAAVTAKTTDDGRREIMVLDERIRPLEATLRTAELVPPPPISEVSQVKFGATVIVKDTSGLVSEYRLVGVDESRPELGEVSYLSPIAQALLNARVGARVAFHFPKGKSELEIVAVSY